jgi:hypothetical protein
MLDALLVIHCIASRALSAEERVGQRIQRELFEDRDPKQAFDIPLNNEQPLTPDVQMSKEYREAREMVDKFLRDERAD